MTPLRLVAFQYQIQNKLTISGFYQRESSRGDLATACFLRTADTLVSRDSRVLEPRETAETETVQIQDARKSWANSLFQTVAFEETITTTFMFEDFCRLWCHIQLSHVILERQSKQKMLGKARPISLTKTTYDRCFSGNKKRTNFLQTLVSRGREPRDPRNSANTRKASLNRNEYSFQHSVNLDSN